MAVVTDQVAPHGEQVRQLFDEKAATWSEKYADHGRLAGRRTRLLRAVHAQVPVGSRVLDLGCGTGELSCSLSAAGMLVTACDISAEMLSRAAEREAGGAVEWIQLDSDWRTLPIESATFDAVVASSVLEYAEDPVRMLRECGRALRAGGVLLCTVPDLRHPVRWLESLAGLAVRLPRSPAIGCRWRRLERFLVYLDISRQRHPVRWWHTVAARAGLRAVSWPTCGAKFSPLLLLTFKRPMR